MMANRNVLSQICQEVRRVGVGVGGSSTGLQDSNAVRMGRTQ